MSPSGEILSNDAPQEIVPYVLAVDDQPENLELLEELLSAQGYEVGLAADGREALESIEKRSPDVLLLDIMMPRVDGYEVATTLRSSRKTAFIPIVMLTALSDVASKVRGLEAGADDFLNKPFRREELLARIRSLARIKRLRDELDTSENIIFAMVSALESKDPRTAGHSNRVAARAARLGKHLRVSPAELEPLVRGALLHDIGKIGVSDEVLQAPRPLPGPLREAFQKHVIVGEQILSPLACFRREFDIIRGHHERLDGSGYPDGLSGFSFPVALEIVAAANLFDDLIYAQGHDSIAAAEMLREEARAGRFHTDLIEDLLALSSPVDGGDGMTLDDLLPPPSVAPTGRILVADDTETNREVLEGILTDAGHEVIAARGGIEALELAAQKSPDLVLVDVRMPDMDGFEVCRRIRARTETEFLPVVLLTAYSELDDRLRGAALGADDFLTTPFNRTELLARVRSLLRLKLYHRDLEQHQNVILSLATVIEAKDPYTCGHSQRVGEIAARLAGELGRTDAECDHLRIAGLLHDIGKVGVPERLLHKPAALTPAEMKTIMTHPSRGATICASLRSVHSILPLIRYHHERFDGKGYPDGLRGEEIPFGARILAIADAFDALTSRRAYRMPLSRDEAIDLLGRETEGGKWDPELYRALVSMVQRGRAEVS
jgi:putative two-component system response regulator